MSDCPAVRCDRCRVRSLYSEDGKLPPGWGQLTLGRAVPYLITGSLDLCDHCFSVVYEFTRSRVAT